MQAFDAMLAAEETKNVSPTQLQEASTTSEELLQPEGKPQLQAQLPPFTEAQQKEIEGAELTSVNAKENSRPKTQTQLTTMCLD
jgi:bacterioferritin (cytochrome b1)